MIKFLKRAVKYFIFIFLLLSIFIFILNILVVKHPDKFLKLIGLKENEVKIGEIESIFLPFFINVKDVRFSFDNIYGKVDSLLLEVKLKRVFTKKFIKVDVSGGSFNYKYIKKDAPKSDSSFKIPPYIFLIDRLYIGNFLFDINYDELNIVGNLTTATLKRDDFNILVEEMEISRRDLAESVKIAANGSIKGQKIILKEANVEGGSINLQLKKFVFSNTSYETNFSLNIKEGFLNIINEHLGGELFAEGKVVDDNIDGYVALNKLKFYNKSLNGKIFFNKRKGIINTENSKITIDKRSFEIESEIDLEKSHISVDVKNINNVFYNHNGETLKLKNLTLSGNYESKEYKVDATVDWLENLNLCLHLAFKDDKVYFDNISLSSNSLNINGNGALEDFKNFQGDFSAEIFNNPFVKKYVDIDHSLKTLFSINYDKSGIKIDGKLNTLEPLAYQGFAVDNISANYLVENNKITITDITCVKEDDFLKADAEITLTNDKPQFIVSGDFYLGLFKYIENDFLKDATSYGTLSVSYIDNKLNGLSNIFIALNEKEVEAKLSMQDSVVYFDSIVYNEYKLKEFGQLDLKRRIIDVSIDNFSFDYKGYEINKLNIKALGEIKNPTLFAGFSLNIEKLQKNFDVKVAGTLDNLNIEAQNQEISAKANLKIKEKLLVCNIDVNNVNINSINQLNGNLSLTSNDLIDFEVIGSLTGEAFSNQLSVESIKLLFDKSSIKDGYFIVLSDKFSNIRVENINLKNNILTLNINFCPAKFYNNYFLDPQFEGGITLLYNLDEKYPELEGIVNIATGINAADYGIYLKGVHAALQFSGREIFMFVENSYLDTNLKGSIYLYDYLTPLNFDGYVTFNNFFINVLNFKGTLDGYLNYSNNILSGDINIVKGEYQFTDFEKSSQETKIPFKLNIDVKTVEPVKVKSEYFKSNIKAKLNVKYTDELKLKGYLETEDAYFNISGIRLNVINGRLTLEEDKLPYLSLKARGTERFSSIILEVSGYLPQYNINIKNVSPTGANFGSLKLTNNTEGELISNLFSGVVFSDIVNITNRLFGINDIGVGGSYEEGGYFLIGRRFTDRLGVKYRLKSGEEGSELVGEYILFDWLNLNLISKEGSSGAGISFYYSF